MALKLALIVPDRHLCRWEARLAEVLAAFDGIEVSLIVRLIGVTPTAQSPSFYEHWPRLWRAYARMDRALFKVSPHAYDPIVPQLQVPKSIELNLDDSWAGPITIADRQVLNAVDQLGIDALVAMGALPIEGPLIEALPFGCWSYRWAQQPQSPPAPAGYWEAINKVPVSGGRIVRRISKTGPPETIRHFNTATDLRSPNFNINQVAWNASKFMLAAMQNLLEIKSSVGATDRRLSDRVASSAAEIGSSNQTQVTPSPRLGRHLRWSLGYLKQRLTRATQWSLAYHLDTSARSPSFDFAGFRLLHPPQGRLWADPFPMAWQGRYFIVFEDYAFRSGIGVLSAIELDRNGDTVGPLMPVLDRPYHLSYPFLFSWQNDIYMLPETRANHRLEIYRAQRFPRQWELAHVPMDAVSMADATLAAIGNRWWLFAGVREGQERSNNDNLYLYYADSPLGRWQPHRQNPVISDAHCARPAGGLMQIGDEWYRPSQDGVLQYGRCININRITRIDTTTFKEQHHRSIAPDWQPGLVGTHTFNYHRGLTVIDEARRIAYWFRRQAIRA